MPAAVPAPGPAVQRHTWIEDVVGIATGAVLASLGLYLLHAGGLVTGGTAGLSLLVSYASGWSYALLFALVNLPFFVLAITRKGWDFAIRTGLTIGLVSGLSWLYGLPGVLHGLQIDPLFAAVVGNLLAGVGVIILFRHRSSIGGFTILALIIQERTGFRAGITLGILDTVVVLSGLFVSPVWLVALSVLGALILNGSLILNHKPGRYLGA